MYDYTSDSQSTYSRFSQGTNRTITTALPIRSNNLKVASPLKRKLSDTTLAKSPEKIAPKPLSPKKVAKQPADIYGSMQVKKSSGKQKVKTNKKQTVEMSNKKKELSQQMKFI
jgi:hypothetical protein